MTDIPLDGLDFDDLPGSASADGASTSNASTVFRPAAVDAIAAPLAASDEAMIFAAPDVPTWAATLGVFDLETTGIDPVTARIVSAHVGVLDASGTSIERRDWLADPGIEIPEGAAAIHGITTERARAEGRDAQEVVGEILTELASLASRGIPVVIYNAPYDLTLLLHEALRHGLRPLDATITVIDPLVIDKAVDRYRRGKRTLTAAAEYYGVDLLDAHDSCADAIAAGRVAQALARRHAAALWVSALELHDMQVGWCQEQTASFIEYMRRVRDPDFTTSGDWPVRSVTLSVAD